MKRIGSYSNAQRAWYDYANENGHPYIIPVSLPNSDDNLNCAEPWHDFGNYKDAGVDENARLYRYDDVIVDLSSGKAWKTKREGEWGNHSESCDYPGRTAFGELIEDYDLDRVTTAYCARSNLYLLYDEDHKKYLIEEQEKAVEFAQAKLKEATAFLDALKNEHPRAYRQIENAMKQVDMWTMSIAAGERHLKEMTERQ